jgi:hypothetical protein
VSSYVRPSIDTPVFRDANGHAIDYGNRWHGSPPEDTYSVDTHPERFAPLHAVADALIAHLRETYDVEIDEDAAADLMHPSFPGVVRSVRIRPNDPACAPLTVDFTSYPGISVRAGLLHDFSYPTCGCDACDSTWQAEADDLERDVLAVASGHYRETVERGLRSWVEYAYAYPDGGARSGRSRARDYPAERLKAATPLLRALPGGWAAWPRV